MGIKQFLTPNVLLQNPGLINSVKANPSESVDNMKLRLKHLRKFYRFMRDDQGMSEKDIIPMMEAHFPRKVKTLIKLAAYIETKIVYLPYNQIPRWVGVSFEAIYSILYHAITTTGDLRSAMRLLTAYLWYKFSEGKEITPPSDVIKTSGLSMSNFKDDLNTSFGIKVKYIKRGVKFRSGIRTFWEIIWNNSIKDSGVTYQKVRKCKSRTRINPPKPIPQSLEDEFALHQLYYPQQSIQLVDQDLPLILSDGIYATIPLVEGIVPILISYLIPPHALYNWLSQSGVGKPGKRISTLYKYATKAIKELHGTIKYIRPNAIQLKLAPRIGISSYMCIQYDLMRKGLLVDKDVLRSIQPPKDHHRNGNRIKELNKFKQKVLENISHTGGWIRGIHNFESHSERVYYKNINIQSFPKCFKRAVIPPSGYEFILLDIMANDLSILFNMAKDVKGLELLNNGQDPYRHLAHIAFPGEEIKMARTKVKEFITPWLYGAGDKTIARGDKLINQTGIKSVKAALEAEFTESIRWIHNLSQSVSNQYSIPPSFNPIDNELIPMPKAFNRRVAPSMIIQRTGAAIMRQAVIWLVEQSHAAQNVMLTVHDSILIAALKEHAGLALVEAIQSIKRGMQLTRGIECLVLHAGKGRNWEEADRKQVPTVCRR